MAGRNFRYSESRTRVVAVCNHQASSGKRLGVTAKGSSVNARHRKRQFCQAARHVVAGRYDDEFRVAIAVGPRSRFIGIADGIESLISEIDAAVERLRIEAEQALHFLAP